MPELQLAKRMVLSVTPTTQIKHKLAVRLYQISGDLGSASKPFF